MHNSQKKTMKSIRDLVLILACSLVTALVFSCATKKTINQLSAEQKVEQKNDISDSKKSQIFTEKIILDQSGDSVEIVTKRIIYDTEKPIVENTGRNPIKEETTVTRTRKGSRTIKTEVKIQENKDSTHTDKSKIETAWKEQQKILVKPGKPAIKYYFDILVLTAALAVVFIIYRNWKKIMDLFS